MRLISASIAAVLAATALAACGTKTPLSLPPQAQPTPVPAVDTTNRAPAESRP